MKRYTVDYFNAFIHAEAVQERRIEQRDARFTGRSYFAIQHNVIESHTHPRRAGNVQMSVDSSGTPSTSSGDESTTQFYSLAEVRQKMHQ